MSYERQLTNTLMAEIAYAGSKGSNLIWVGNINEVQPGPGTQASRRLIQPLSNVVTINYFDTNNRSSYNGLQVKLNQRFSRGLQFLASYTFGKSLDYAGSPASGGGAVGGPQSVTLFEQSRGPSGFDVKHRFVLSWVWALPFGDGPRAAGGGLLKPILENWQFGGIVTLSTGPALHRLPEHRRQQRRALVAEPDRRRPPRQPHGRAVVRHRPPSSRRPPTPTANSGRGVLYAPGTQTVDVSLSRTFPIKHASACSSGPTPSTCSTPPSSGSRTRTSARRRRAASPRPLARQPLDAVRAQAGLLRCRCGRGRDATSAPPRWRPRRAPRRAYACASAVTFRRGKGCFRCSVAGWDVPSARWPGRLCARRRGVGAGGVGSPTFASGRQGRPVD